MNDNIAETVDQVFSEIQQALKQRGTSFRGMDLDDRRTLVGDTISKYVRDPVKRLFVLGAINDKYKQTDPRVDLGLCEHFSVIQVSERMAELSGERYLVRCRGRQTICDGYEHQSCLM